MLEENISPVEISKSLGCQNYHVHNVKYHWNKTRNRVEFAKAKAKPVAGGDAVTPDACLAITVDPEHVVSLKLRNPDLQGTLYVSKHGVAYSKPNAKLKPTEFLSFDMLAKLVESGVFTAR